MNLRKGTFRLWVILSVMFVFGVAAASYANIQTAFRNAYTDWNAEFAKYGGYSVVPADCQKARGTLRTDYTQNVDGLCWYEFSKFRQLYPEYKDISDKELSKRLYIKAGRPLVEFHPWLMVAKTVGIAVGTPLTFLALGWALFWALAGLKSQPVAIPVEFHHPGDAS